MPDYVEMICNNMNCGYGPDAVFTNVLKENYKPGEHKCEKCGGELTATRDLKRIKIPIFSTFDHTMLHDSEVNLKPKMPYTGEVDKGVVESFKDWQERERKLLFSTWNEENIPEPKPRVLPKMTT